MKKYLLTAAIIMASISGASAGEDKHWMLFYGSKLNGRITHLPNSHNPFRSEAACRGAANAVRTAIGSLVAGNEWFYACVSDR